MLNVRVEAARYIKAGRIAEAMGPVRKFKIPAVVLDGALYDPAHENLNV
jgi:hypothetical protein